jgi:hypothetical protein
MSAAPPRGAAMDVFNFGGGRCQTMLSALPDLQLRHPPGGQPSTSSTLVVAAVRPCRQHLPGPVVDVTLASPPREESSGAAMYPTTHSGLWTTGINKGLAAPGTQLSSHVFKAWSRVTESPARRAGRYSSVQQCNADPADHSWTWLQW